MEKVRADAPATTEQEADKKEQEPKRVESVSFDDAQFEGSVVVRVEGNVGYAIRKMPDGRLEGNEVRYMESGDVGPIYQMHESDFSNPELAEVVNAAKEAMENREGTETGALLGKLFRAAESGELDPSWGRTSKELEASRGELKQLLATADQRAIAEHFFNETIGRDIGNNKAAYHVYQYLKGTEFAERFHELEDERLKAAGYQGFSL